MSNVRIIHNNVAEQVTSITANSTAVGSVPVTTLLTNLKSSAHRTAGTSVTYTLTWSTDQAINGIILPATNLSSTATIRVQALNSVGAGVGDSNTVLACPGTTLDGYLGVKNVNSFPYGGLSKTAVWFTTNPTTVRTLTITLTDTNKASLGNPAYPAYIDCSRIICGKYWQPTIGASRNNLSVQVVDNTQTTRTDGGDLVSDRGSVHDQLSFGLDILTKTDKEELIKILKTVGIYKNIAISVFQDSNSRNEQDYLIYGRVDSGPINYLVHNYYSHNITVTGW